MAARGGRARRIRAMAPWSVRGGATPPVADRGAAIDRASSGGRVPRTLALLLYGGVFVQFIAGLVVWMLAHRRGTGAAAYSGWRETLAIHLPFATLGVVVARRRPRQPLGWLFLAIGLGGATTFLLRESAAAAFGRYGASVTAAVAVWIAALVEWTVLGALVAVLVLFPSGRPGSRWSWSVLWVIVISVVFGGIYSTFPPGDRQIVPRVGNPFGFGAMPTAVASVVDLGVFLLPVALVCGIVTLAVRFVTAREGERQQLKIFLYAVTVGGAVFALPAVVRIPLVGGWFDTPAGATVRWLFLPAAVAVAIGVAILRHGLYDIDRIISRTVVYAGVTAVLGVGYSGVVLLSGQVPGADGEVPSWMVAASTLAAAAVFRPLRHAIQARVEQRFNRTRYDMRRTIDEFTQRLRDDAASATVDDELIAVIQQALQPTTTVLWLAPSARALGAGPRLGPTRPSAGSAGRPSRSASQN